MKLRRVSSWVAAIVVATASLIHLLQAETGAPLAQQRAQTDLDFVGERARIETAQSRIVALRQRLARLERAARAQQGPAATGAVRAPAQQAERQGERRIPQTLTHRDRLVTVQTARGLNGRLDAAAEAARSLGERINRPDFGAGLSALEQEIERLDAEIAGYE